MPFTVQQAKTLLLRAEQGGRMPHALLITGAPEDGTYRLVSELVEELNGARAESLEKLLHPLCRVISPSSKIRSITIQAVRSVEPFLAMRAEPGQTKVVIVTEADRLSEDSANAFLKTLEEPPAQSLIILITRIPDRLLPTILSRCIRLDIVQSVAAGVRLSAAQKNFLPAVRKAMAGLGANVTALALRSDFLELLAQERAAVTERITAAVKEEAARYKDSTGVTDWEAGQRDATAALIETKYLEVREQMLELLHMALGQAVLSAVHAVDVQPLMIEAEQAAARHPVPELLLRMKAVEALMQDLSYNVHEALALDARFIQAVGQSPAL